MKLLSCRPKKYVQLATFTKDLEMHIYDSWKEQYIKMNKIV